MSEETEKVAARAAEREAATALRLRDASAALLAANQELARIPVLEHRLAVAEEENEELSHRLQDAGESFRELTGSSSWRLTAPLRALGRLRSRRRSG
jgi:hypothetical protein